MRILVAGTAVLCILLSPSFEAGAIELEKGRFALGGEINLIRNRSVQGDSQWWGEKTARLSSEQFLLRGDYQATERISLLIMAGLADLEVHRFEGETHFFDRGFGYGAGVNASLFEDIQYGYRIDIGLRYFTFEPDKGKTTGVAARKLLYAREHEVTIDWEEWQAFLVFRKDLEFFDLCVGSKYSNVKCDQERVWPGGDTEKATFEPEDNFGFFAGIGIEISPELSTSFEVRFVDETVFTLGMTYRF